MPAKQNPVHMDAFPALTRLSRQAGAMATDSTRKPLTFEQQNALLVIAIHALKASGVSVEKIETEVKLQFNHLVPQGLQPSPASQETKFDPIPAPAKVVEPVTATAQSEKKGGLFR